MRQTYVSPAVVEYGSIADCTFVTPAVASKYPGAKVQLSGRLPGGQDGDYICTTGGLYTSQTGKPGGKNYIVLQCDKFGEYSHGAGTGS